MVRRLYGRLRSRNPVPSRYDVWEDGEATKDIPTERIIGGPSFRSSQDDDLIQMADLIAHALLKQEEEPSPKGGGPGPPPGLRDPRPRPQTEGIEARSPRHRQAVIEAVYQLVADNKRESIIAFRSIVWGEVHGRRTPKIEADRE